MATGIARAGSALATTPTALPPLTGKLWIFSLSQTQNAILPVPSTTPDAIFTTHHIAFMGEGAEPGNRELNFNYRICTFLDSVERIPEADIKFSGLVDPILKKPVTCGVPLGNGVGYSNNSGTYGTYIEFSGQVYLDNGSTNFYFADGYSSLMIDGTPVASTNYALIGGYAFNGQTGVHTIDLIYTENSGGEAELFFAPLP
jgi:hypothetical protein